DHHQRPRAAPLPREPGRLPRRPVRLLHAPRHLLPVHQHRRALRPPGADVPAAARARKISRRQKAEGRRQKAEGREDTVDGARGSSGWFSPFCLLPSERGTPTMSVTPRRLPALSALWFPGGLLLLLLLFLPGAVLLVLHLFHLDQTANGWLQDHLKIS